MSPRFSKECESIAYEIVRDPVAFALEVATLCAALGTILFLFAALGAAQ